MNNVETEACGTTFRFSALSGEVIGTEQRSDSYTTGSSRAVVIDGSGGGSGQVNTTVVVRRDIWLRTSVGDEHHVRVQADLPIRVGQRISILSLHARKPSTNRTFDNVVSVYSPAMDKYWTVRDLGDVAQLLPLPNWPRIGYQAYILLWMASIAASVFVVGIPVLIFLIIRAWRGNTRCGTETAAILAAFRAGHQALIRDEYEDWRRETDRLRKPVQAAPAVEAQDRIADDQHDEAAGRTLPASRADGDVSRSMSDDERALARSLLEETMRRDSGVYRDLASR